MATFRIESWNEGDHAPDLWTVLGGAVCRKPERAGGTGTKGKRGSGFARVAIDDSKKLKLANSAVTRDPLVHLERGVLTMLRCATIPAEDDGAWLERGGGRDEGYFARVGVSAGAGGSGTLSRPWYSCGAEDGLRCPRECDVGQVSIAANLVRGVMRDAGVDVGPLLCRALGEGEFNDVVEAARTKAAATELALGEHLRSVWNGLARDAASFGDGVRVVCDRQGGRTQYGNTLERLLGPDHIDIQVLEETPARSRYEVVERCESHGGRRMIVMFMPEAESAHLPVALASMAAKLTRELLMARFNRYWQARMPELKPTAGYRQDGWRWLQELGSVASGEERKAMIRRA
jgi:hypothetical protein